MDKAEVINSIQNHLDKFNKFAGFKCKKNRKYLEWVDEYFKDTELENCNHVEKCWVLMHNDNIEHCITCGIKSIFGNFNLGYRSKHCKKCGSPEGYRKLAKKRKEQSPEILISKKCKQCNKIFSYKTYKLNNTISKDFCSKSCARIYDHKHISEEKKMLKSEKTRKTNFKKYGNEYVVNSKYSRKKTFEKLGVEYPLQDPVIQEKTKISFFNKTGYYYPCQNPSTLEKMIKTKISRYGDLLIPMSKYKQFIMPSGKKINIQGNEAYALNLLLKTHEENDIFVGRKNIENQIGKIVYIDKNNKRHIYYPDIYIKSEHKIYEVKSSFTYNVHKEINELKKLAVLNKKIDFEFLIIN
jgi:hypothetical protein